MTNDTNSGSKSADEVQREVRQSRAEVEDALEAIQDRLSPSQMFDQAVNYLRGSGGNEFMRNLGATVRDNPVPVALLGTGLAWLMLSRARPRRPYDEDEDRPGGYGADYYGAGDYPAGSIPRATTTASATGRSVRRPQPGPSRGSPPTRDSWSGPRRPPRRRAPRPRGWPKALRSWGAIGPREHANQRRSGAPARGRQPGKLAHGVRRLGADARERLGDTGDISGTVRAVRKRAPDHGRRIRRGFFDTLHEQPLVLGAVGLAVGAAIGAALPATETEDEWMGDTRDRLKDHASEAGREQLAKVGAAAGAAYDAAREEADRQGLTPEAAVAGAGSMAEKVERVAEAASDAANTEAERQKLGQTDDKPV